ncbi:uncharacterized protein [Nicotiana sylvestris]|uniref:uncharacterized protein n=1 Tax=Nicotiana sylvestris TaxID=4096 RepID=UPI00388CD153
MSLESHLPTVPIVEDSPISAIPTSESATAEENKILRLCMMEMWDAWSNGREPLSAIPGFPKLLPRESGTSNVPISYPNTLLGYPTISAHFSGTPSEACLQVLIAGMTTNIFAAPPCSATTQPNLPRPSFDPSSFTFQGLSGQKSVSYADLCMFPHVQLPLGFKTPKFEKYDGHGDPIAHLKRYCNQLRGTGRKEELLMDYFGESLVDIAFEWYMDQDISHWHIWDDLARDFVRFFQYNIDIAPDRNSLSNLKKRSSESFREYTVKWREQAARVKPSMDEIEMVSIFLQAQEADYFQNMMFVMGKPFAEAIKIGEMVENGLKTGRILSQSAIRATSQAIQGRYGSVANRKKKEEVAMATSSVRKSRPPRPYFPARTPQHYYPHQDMAYAMVPQPYAVMNAQPYVRPQQ